VLLFISVCNFFDLKTVDKASVDLVNAAAINPMSAIGSEKDNSDDRFKITHPKTNWKECLNCAEKIGLGSQQYELIEVQ
jgi:uncharacterized Fe-S center protein